MLICRYVLQKNDFNTVEWCRCRITLRKCRTPTLIIKSSPMRRSEVLGVQSSDLCFLYTKMREWKEWNQRLVARKKQQNQKATKKTTRTQYRKQNQKTDSQNDKNDHNPEVGALGWESLRGAHGLAGRRANAVSVHAFLGLSPAAEPRPVWKYTLHTLTNGEFSYAIYMNSSNILHFTMISYLLAFEDILLTITFSEERKKNTCCFLWSFQ